MSEKFAQWEVWVPPPRQNAGQTASNCRVLACTTTTASQQIDTDILSLKNLIPAPGAPNQPASDLGELPSAGHVMVRFHAKGGDIWILFGPNASVIVDATDVTAANFGDRIPQDQYVDYVLSPLQDRFFSARTASGTATLKYRLSGPPSNSRP